MYPEEQGIARPTKPGPIARAVSATGIAASAQTAPRPVDLDPFAYRGGYSADAPKGPRNGPDSTALDPAPQGIASRLPQPAANVAAATFQRQGGIAGGLASVSTGIGNEGAVPPVIRQVVGDHAPSPNTQAGIAGMPVGLKVQQSASDQAALEALKGKTAQGAGIAANLPRVSSMPAGSTAPDGRGIAGQKLITNVADGQSVVDDSASALRDQQSSNPYWSPAAQLERMQRRRLMSDVTDPSVTDPDVRQRAAVALGATRNQHADALAAERTTGQQIRNEQAQRLNDLQQQLVSEVDPTRRQEIAGQIKALNGRTEPQAGASTLTLPQRRSNFEIDAARERIAGMSPEEIKRKTANYTATGRENPDFDPTLAKAVSLANRRKYGEDADFDQRQAQQPAGDDGDVATRFKSDRAMQGHTLGKQTDSGVEVFDASGKLVGHYR